MSIIQLTERALTHLQHISSSEGGYFHLAVKKAGCSGYLYCPSMIKAPSVSDQVVTISDQLVIYLDGASIDYLRGTTIDYVSKGLGQQQMVFHNPNAASECGCGESFFLAEDQLDD